MHILIVEDEKLAVDKLLQVLYKVRPDAQVIAVTDSITASVAWLNEHPDDADLVLMDIELADGQSFAIFDRVRIRCPVIFVTSYDEYALKAFKVHSIDYLLKPIQQDELQQAFDKLDAMQAVFSAKSGRAVNIDNLIRELQKTPEIKNYRKRFLVKYLQQLVSIETSAIAYFYYEDRVSFFATTDGRKYMLDYSLDEVEQMVDPAAFFRINRGLIISITSIRQIHPYFGNRLLIKTSPVYDKEAVVSREKVNEFKTWMGK